MNPAAPRAGTRSLRPAVRVLVADGQALVRRALIAEFLSRPEPGCPCPELLDELTAREREVVALVALGLSNGEIAERLILSPATVKVHVSRAMVKLHAHDRAKLVVFGYEAGLVSPRREVRLHPGP
jgi:DNA-binding NarL/FixJ family response regulator